MKLFVLLFFLLGLGSSSFAQNIKHERVDTLVTRITYILKSDNSDSKFTSRDISKDSVSLVEILSPYIISMNVYKGEDVIKNFGINNTEIVIVYFLKDSFVEKLPLSIKDKFYKTF